MKRRTRIFKSLFLVPLVMLATGGAGAFAKVTTTMAQFTTFDPNKSPWAFSLSANGERGMGYQADSWDLTTGVSVVRTFKNQTLASAGIGFRSILYREYSGQVFDRYDAHPELYGPTDLALSYVIPGAYEAEPITLTPMFKLVLPTSTISRDASLLASLQSNVSFDVAVNNWLTIGPSIGATFSQYRYDDANEAGTVINSPFSLDYDFYLSASPLEKLIITSGYGQTQRYNYQGDWTVIQSAYAKVQYRMTRQVEATGSYSWNDKIISNEPAFAYDKNSVTLGLKATIQ